MKVVETIYNGGRCQNGVKLSDANELLDYGLGQYAMDFTPDNIYYIDADCGTTCKNGDKTWTNCQGFTATGGRSIKLPIIIGIVVVFLVILFILLKKKK